MRRPSRTTIPWSGPGPTHRPTTQPHRNPALTTSAKATGSAATAPPPTPPAVRWPRDAAHQLGGRGIAVQLDGRTPSRCRSKSDHPACRARADQEPDGLRSLRLTVARRRGFSGRFEGASWDAIGPCMQLVCSLRPTLSPRWAHTVCAGQAPSDRRRPRLGSLRGSGNRRCRAGRAGADTGHDRADDLAFDVTAWCGR
jgi:hypothetical protein